MVTLDIETSLEWTATGIEVGPGDTLTIDAEPAQTHGLPPVSPDGISQSPTYSTAPVADLPAPDLPVAALIGRIGGGPVFLVGSHYNIKATDAGPLELRWNIAQAPLRNVVLFFPAVVRHEPAERDSDPDDVTGNEIATNEVATGNLIAEDRPVETVGASPPSRRKKAANPPAATDVDSASGMAWLLPGLGLLLLAAVAAALTFRRVSRARAVERTRAMVGVSPSLDLAEGSCRGDDLPAEGPAASLRARLEPGRAHMEEGNGHG
ncbi:MAG TPA: hypothetical protein VFP12_06025 [Allosphingosinicella sp.]|nr:hypothetical protein [Allosphingosinicella sp.]